MFGRVAIGSGFLTATALDVCALILGETGLDPRIDTGLAVTGRGLLTATGHIVSVCVPLPAGKIGVTHAFPSRSRDRSRSRGRLPASPARSQAGETGQLARRNQQEGVEAVVSQPPAVSEVSVAVTPAAGGAVFSALPSAVQDLARFFLTLSGFSSLGAVGGVAGVTAPTAGSGFSCALRLLQLVQSHLVLRLRYLLELVILLLPAAVPGVPGLQQRQVDFRSRGRRRRSSSGGSDRRS